MTPENPSEPLPTMTPAPAVPPRISLLRRIATEGFLIVFILGVAICFGVFVLGMQLPGMAQSKEEKPVDKDKKDAEPAIAVKLVKDRPHTIEVPEEVRTSIRIRKGDRDILAIATTPREMRPMVLPGSTALDPTRLARIHLRFSARVVEIGRTDRADVNGPPEPGDSRLGLRELRTGDEVKKDQVLGVFYSDVVGSQKNNLLNALVQLNLDDQILERASDKEGRAATPDVLYWGFLRAVYGDRNTINQTLMTLKAWDIPQKEIDDLQEEARKITADRDHWLKTPEGRWVKGEKQANDNYRENPWGRVTLRAPFDGVIVERNLHVDEMVVDNTINHFQIADVSRLMVAVNCPEDQLPILRDLERKHQTRWTIKTAGAELEGSFNDISYLIDPAQHTAVVKGYVTNPEKRLVGGQYATAAIKLPPPPDVVEVPFNAVADDGKQSLVFVQTNPARPDQYTMRRVQVMNRFEKTVFVRSSPIPQEEALTPEDAEEGLLPKEPLLPGEKVLQSGTGELKLALLQMESKALAEAKQEEAKRKVKADGEKK